MVVSLKELFLKPGGFIDFDYTTDLSSEEVFFEKPFKTPVRFYGAIENHAGAVTLSADIEAVLSVRCSRCDKPITDYKSVSVDMVLVPFGSDIADEDDLVCEVHDEQELNDILIPELILNMDMCVLCKEGCRGRCFKCGADLNEGECACKKEEKQTPFSALKNIKI